MDNIPLDSFMIVCPTSTSTAGAFMRMTPAGKNEIWSKTNNFHALGLLLALKHGAKK